MTTKSHNYIFLEKLHEIRKHELQKKLEGLTLDEIRPLCKKYDHSVYAKSKERLIEKFVNHLVETNNVEDALYELEKQTVEILLPESSNLVSVPQLPEPRICHIRLDEDYEQWRVFPEGKTKEDLKYLLDSFFNAKSKV